MIIPKYWAEGRLQNRQAGKQITVRRFGWSDTSPAEAQTHADSRAEEALKRLLSGEKLERRDPKIPYNGADGLPIREEILDRRGETILTRNSYGAVCLNTPNVFFADVDFAPAGLSRIAMYLISAAMIVGLVLSFTHSKSLGVGIIIGSFVIGGPLSQWICLGIRRARGGDEKIARKKIERFSTKNPEWNFRIYRTPAGYRILATHKPFNPNDPLVAECFSTLGTDRIYSIMCRNQQCFRARVSPKPWRIGITNHMRPRPGVWPVKEEYLPARHAWLREYHAKSEGFSSCKFLESIGSGIIHPDVLPVTEWHDELSKANSLLPIA